jgi:hypothetical protein
LWQTSKACPTVRTILIAWLWEEGRKRSEGYRDFIRIEEGLGWIEMSKGMQSKTQAAS